MSLRVWIPFTDGTEKNQGTSNLTFTNSNSSKTYSSDSGKLGKCFYNNGYYNQSGLISNENITLPVTQSWFCWAKFDSFGSSASLNGVVTNHDYANKKNMGITVLYLSSTTGKLSCNTGTGSSRTYNTYTGNTTLNAGTWYHIGFTYDGSNIRFYVNGELDGTTAYSGLSLVAAKIGVFRWDAMTENTYNMHGSLNDIRIYDHCLTSQEVKELAKGLVIHYPLDDGNITNIAYDSSGYSYNGTISGTIGTNTYTPRYNSCVIFDGSTSAIQTGFNFSNYGNDFTLSAWVKSNVNNGGYLTAIGNELSNGGIVFGELVAANSIQCYLNGTSGADINKCGYNYFTANTWYHVVYTVKDALSAPKAKLYINGTLASSADGTAPFGEPDLPIIIGCNRNHRFWNGNISDFRIYATALSADDIKELYNTAAFIDNKGNIGCYLFYEDANSQVMKTGQVKTGEFKEVSKNLFNKDEVDFNSCNYGSVPNAFTMTGYTGKCTPAKSIPIKPNTWYVLSYDETTVSVNSQAFNTTWWDITGKVKVAEDTSGGSLGFYNKVKLKSPANAYFVSFSNFGSLSDANLLILVNSLQLEEGEAFTSYEPHFIDVAAVYNNKIECNKLIEI